MSTDRTSDVLDGRMVFLVGARRSGTNWLQRVLASHPAIATIPSETHLFSHGLAPLVSHVHHGPRSSTRTASVHMERDDLIASCRDLCDRAFAPHLAAKRGAELLLERTPWHVYHLDLIRDVYPDARIVSIVRDGRDVVRSMMTQQWGSTKPADVRAAAEEWADAVRSAQPFVDGAGGIEVRYEAMLSDPSTVVGDLFRWLGVEVTDELVHEAVGEAGRTFNVDPSAPTPTAGKWRSGLSPAEVDDVLDVAGPLLRELGYEDDDAEITPPARPRRRPSTSVRRVVGRARRATRTVERPWAPHRDATVSPRPQEGAAATVDRLLTAIHTGSSDGLRDATAPDVRVRVVTAGTDETARGERGRALLHETMAPFRNRRQIRGNVHPGGGNFTVVLGYESDDGGPPRDVVVVANPTPRHVRAVNVYLFPLDQA